MATRVLRRNEESGIYHWHKATGAFLPATAEAEYELGSMAETFKLLGESFSTADAEAPVLFYESGVLHVRFRDWREREVEITFREAVAFSWDDGDAACSVVHRDDASYIVAGSEWLGRHIAVGTVPSSGGHRHYKLCFNAAGVLQVIAESLDVRA